MTVIITDRAEWDRILAARDPSPLYVSSEQQWFRNGRGTVFLFLERDNA